MKTWSQYGDWETRGEAVDAAVQPVAGIHHWHGDTCLCGAKSGTARGRTEHIIDQTLAALVARDALVTETDWEYAVVHNTGITPALGTPMRRRREIPPGPWGAL